jgi:alpha-aminoadipate carrier protein LysW
MGKNDGMKTYCIDSIPVVYAIETEKRVYKSKCPDCDVDLDVPTDTTKGEILSCPGCGLELEVESVDKGKVNLKELVIEGEDWGE